jgi:hypothetical protein
MVIQYHICDRCGKKVTSPEGIFVLEIRNKYDYENRTAYFELCVECAKIAKEYYELQKEEVMEKQKTA